MTPWEKATLALGLLAIDPQNLGGLVVRARIGPAQKALVEAACQMTIPSVRLNPHMTAQVLDGDIDLSATLSGGSLVQQRGLLDRPPSLFVLPMAERTEPYMAARLCQALDAGRSHAILALDEGADDGEALPAGLSDRAAFHVTLDGVALSDITPIVHPEGIAELRRKARKTAVADGILEDLVVLAVSLGITSLRAPGFALRTAQTHAALNGRDTVTSDDVTTAVALTYAHRATRLPQDAEPDSPPPDAQAEAPPSNTQETPDRLPDEILLEAVTSALPPDVLADLTTGKMRKASGSGSGSKRIGNRRGRPLPARQGAKSNAARVDLIATLRAAIPWQTLRKQSNPEARVPIFRSSDLRQKRYETMSDRLLIFTVDASGSAAMSRLPEAKGAVELMLSEAYARRDHVALVSYRGTEAEVLLPPTRSLVQTKRRLAALPGGGATPLAAGLTAAISVAKTAAQKGLTPTLVLLADGRANIALDGVADRARAATDAQQLADQISAARIDAIVIDTSNRPEKSLSRLATGMRAKYLPLPRADAKRMSAAIAASMAE